MGPLRRRQSAWIGPGMGRWLPLGCSAAATGRATVRAGCVAGLKGRAAGRVDRAAGWIGGAAGLIGHVTGHGASLRRDGADHGDQLPASGFAMASASPDPPIATAAAVPGIGVGTWAWGNQLLWGYAPDQDAELEACFRRAVELGLRFFDTADSYGTGRFAGRSEILLGRFCSRLHPQHRSRLTLATKLAPFPWRLGRRGYRRAFEASRGRLMGKLDRVQLHWSTARYLPWQELPLLDGLADLVLEGRVSGLGVSNLGPRRLRWLHGHLAARGVPLRSLQVQLSLLAPQPIAAGGVAEVCRELGIELIAYSPLALGLLTRPAGPPPDFGFGPRSLLCQRIWPRIQPLLQAMQTIARERRSDLAAVALNWCRSHGALPIPGLRRVAQAEAAAAALAWQLCEAERLELDALARACLIAGGAMAQNPFQSD